MQKVSWVIVGLLIGMLVATTMPVQAHHSYSVDRLKRRIAALESSDYYQDISIGNIDRDLTAVERKTSNIDSSGYLNSSYIKKPIGCYSGDAAFWAFNGISC